MKKTLSMLTLMLASAAATAGETVTLVPGTYKDTDYVRVYCHDWGQAHPASSEQIVHLAADAFRRCTYSTLTYKRQRITRVMPASPLAMRTQPGDRRPDLLEMDRDYRSDWEKMQDEKDGFEIRIPIWHHRF